MFQSLPLSSLQFSTEYLYIYLYARACSYYEGKSRIVQLQISPTKTADNLFYGLKLLRNFKNEWMFCKVRGKAV